MNQTFHTINIHKGTKVNHTGHHALDNVTHVQLSETLRQAIFDSFLLGENQLVVFAVRIQDTHLHWLTYQAVQALQNLILVCRTNSWVMLGRQLAHRQESTNAFVFRQQTTTVCIKWRNFNHFRRINPALDFIPALLLGCLTER